MKSYIIIHKSDEHQIEIDAQKYSKATKAIMNAPGYIEYIKKYGYHFNEKLACKAVEMMEPRNKSGIKLIDLFTEEKAKWYYEKLKSNFKSTIHDLIVTSCMAYSDFYPTVVKTEDDCWNYGVMVATDIDGYEGIQFMRWTSDIIGKEIIIDWKEVI